MSSPQVQGSGGSGQVPEQQPDAAKELEDIMHQLIDQIVEGTEEELEKKTGKKKDEAAQLGDIVRSDVFGLLGKTVGMPGSFAAAIKEILANPGPPGGPKLPLPIRDLRDTPKGNDGSGNPWLDGSIFSDLIIISMDVMRVMFDVKLSEAAIEAEQIILMQEVTVKSAEMAKKKKELEAKEIRLEAMKLFVQAGISIAMAAMQAAATSKSTIKSAASKLKTAGGMAFRGTKMAAGRMNGFVSRRYGVDIGQKFGDMRITKSMQSFRQWKTDTANRKSVLAGRLKGEKNYLTDKEQKLADKGWLNKRDARAVQAERRKTALTKGKSTDKASERGAAKRMEKGANMQIRNQMFMAVNQGLTSAAGGLFDLQKAVVREQIGVVEYLQTIFQGMQTLHQKMIESSHEARREASDQISNTLQQLQSIIQAQEAFRIRR